jgi:hypothetical protein
MSNPTSNFGWQMPTSTDLVTDLPADFEVFGQAVDTSLADLKGGTTGQLLQKNSGTDMDFVWATASGWNPNYSLINSGGTALTGASSITVSGISGKNSLRIFVYNASAGGSAEILVTVNGDTAANYGYFGGQAFGRSTANVNNVQEMGATAANNWPISQQSQSGGSWVHATLAIEGTDSSGIKMGNWTSGADSQGSDTAGMYVAGGYYTGTSTISSVTLTSSSGNFDTGGNGVPGYVYVYGA